MVELEISARASVFLFFANSKIRQSENMEI